MQSNSKTTTLVIVIVIALLLIGYLWYITMPRNVPSSTVIAVPADLLDNEDAKTIEKAPTYGNVPVTVTAAEKGRPDPFAGV
ncbi:MAG: hypothetical protein MUO78_04900 [candidate division Zixibacteria bacterium]|nr:hypothetical protein [candidate division Zixibacteria bacterium]